MKTKVPSFHLQPTKTFDEGAPQRESYDSNEAHERACVRYGLEWCQQYECAANPCRNRDCPQHHPIFLRA